MEMLIIRVNLLDYPLTKKLLNHCHKVILIDGINNHCNQNIKYGKLQIIDIVNSSGVSKDIPNRKIMEKYVRNYSY